LKTLLRAALFLAVAAMPAAARQKEIVFLAGPRDHGMPGRHEYEKDLRSLAWALEHATNVPALKTRVVLGRVPHDISVLANASVNARQEPGHRKHRDGRGRHRGAPPAGRIP
jgi:hypothetical protein